MSELIVALDFASANEALTLARLLRPCAPWLKIGLELFTSAGPELVRAIKRLDFKVFLDLKFYDIPHTVGRAVAAAASLEVNMLTLHLQGGQRMCQAAREALEPFSMPPLLVGVTALTSFASGEMPGIELAPGEFGAFLASQAPGWGLNGVVASGHEVSVIKRADPALLCVCPGIRPRAAKSGVVGPDGSFKQDIEVNDDQRRVMTPGEAVSAGADFLVVGRPVTQSASPLEAARAILAEMRAAE